MKKIFESRILAFVCALSLSLSVFGCATTRHPLPQDMMGRASVDGMSDVRMIMGIPNPVIQKSMIESLKEENSSDYPVDDKGVRWYPILAISGGAANGAYGAGLLKGWSEEGSRPKFKAITGISTGAIIAPMVFLGKEYDPMMEELYTTLSTKDVMSIKGPVRALLGNSMASNAPLAKQLDKYITMDMLEKVAKEHRAGRRLYVGTTQLDAQRLSAWDMGAIACKGDLKLFRQVILASAAIPVIFPPSLIHVEAGGRSYDEMHVDGGIVAQVFTFYHLLYGAGDMAKEMGVDPSKIRANYYIIRNGYVTAGYDAVKNDIASVANRSFDTIINAQGIGDTYRIYAYMKKLGNGYNLAFIPGDFRPKPSQMFDPCEMKELFDKGYEDAVGGYKWHKMPPGLESNQDISD